MHVLTQYSSYLLKYFGQVNNVTKLKFYYHMHQFHLEWAERKNTIGLNMAVRDNTDAAFNSWSPFILA